MTNSEHSHEHFKGKDAIGHVAAMQVEGLMGQAEMHGAEPPGYRIAGADAAQDTALLLLIVFSVMPFLSLSLTLQGLVLLTLSVGWLLWKMTRSARFGWARLERLHRLLEQERFEIQHHRQQERDELRVLYAAKGFEGKLLEDVLDVLMADENRLLQVMIQEEMGLQLESQEHPLKQAVGSACGSILASVLCLMSFWFFPLYGLPFASFLVLGWGGAYLAKESGNRLIAAFIWNVGMGVLSAGITYFLARFLITI